MSDAEKQTSRMAAILVTLLIVGGAVAVAVIMTANPPEAPGISLGARIRGALKAHPDGVLLQASGVAAAPEAPAYRALAATLRASEPGATLVVDYPNDASVFPPDFVAPTFLWHDPAKAADAWAVEIAFADGKEPMRLLLPPAEPPTFEIDPDVLGPTNEVYELTPYQASAQAWTPPLELWEEIKQRSVEKTAVVTFVGFDTDAPDRALSQGTVRIIDVEGSGRRADLLPRRSADAGPGGEGPDQAAAEGDPPVRRVAHEGRVASGESKVVLKAMPSCANCHSFSEDGKTLAMDVEGPQRRQRGLHDRLDRKGDGRSRATRSSRGTRSRTSPRATRPSASSRASLRTGSTPSPRSTRTSTSRTSRTTGSCRSSIPRAGSSPGTRRKRAR